MKKIDENNTLYELLNAVRKESLSSNNMSMSYKTDSFYVNKDLYFILSLLEGYEEIELVLVSAQGNKPEAFAVYGNMYTEIPTELFEKERERQGLLSEIRKQKKEKETLDQIEAINNDNAHMENLKIFKNNPNPSGNKFLSYYLTFCRNLGFTRKVRDLSLSEIKKMNNPVYVFSSKKDGANK